MDETLSDHGLDYQENIGHADDLANPGNLGNGVQANGEIYAEDNGGVEQVERGVESACVGITRQQSDHEMKIGEEKGMENEVLERMDVDEDVEMEDGDEEEEDIEGEEEEDEEEGDLGGEEENDGEDVIDEEEEGIDGEEGIGGEEEGIDGEEGIEGEEVVDGDEDDDEDTIGMDDEDIASQVDELADCSGEIEEGEECGEDVEDEEEEEEQREEEQRQSRNLSRDLNTSRGSYNSSTIEVQSTLQHHSSSKRQLRDLSTLRNRRNQYEEGFDGNHEHMIVSPSKNNFDSRVVTSLDLGFFYLYFSHFKLSIVFVYIIYREI